MANKKIWLGILIIVLVFGMSVTGCDAGGFKIGSINVNMDAYKYGPDNFGSESNFVYLRFQDNTLSSEYVDDMKLDFELKIDGSIVTINSIYVAESIIELRVALNTFIPGIRYKIQVQYTENSDRPIQLFSGGNLGSFNTGEKNITAKQW